MGLHKVPLDRLTSLIFIRFKMRRSAGGQDKRVDEIVVELIGAREMNLSNED